MMPTAHPAGEMLIDYASGAASAGAALLVAAHATYCARCRREIAALEAAGGLALARIEAAPPPSLDATLAGLDAPEAAAPPCAAEAPTGGGALPRCVAAAAGGNLADLRWRFVAPGVSASPLPLGAADETLTLLRAKPGVAAPTHTHTGDETTLVLAGSLVDRGATYRAGDVATAEAGEEHRPRAGRGGECVCLTLQRGSIRLTGRLGWALDLFR